MKYASGFIALITVIIVVILITIVGIVASLSSIQLGASGQSNSLKYVLDQGISSCLDRALLQLAFDDTDVSTGSLSSTLPNGHVMSCRVISITSSAPNWLITTDASIDGQPLTVKRLYTVSQETLLLTSQAELTD